VPPEVGVTLLPEIADRAPAEVFFNPGAESPELLAKAKELGIHPILECSIVNIGLSPESYSD
jgi:hypothetical protein